MKMIFTLAAILILTLLACGGPTIGLPALTATSAQPGPVSTPVESGDGTPVAGDCTTPINPGEDIQLPVTKGVVEVREGQFISVAGEVTNTTDGWVQGVLVWVRMCDESGATLLHVESLYTLPSQIPPGGTAAFQLLRDVANTESGVRPGQYTIEALALPGDDSKRAELAGFTAERDGDKLTLHGTFQNTGSAPCLSPSVVIVYYKDGLVYETDILPPAEISEIPTGGSSEIDDYVYPPAGITDTKFWAACD